MAASTTRTVNKEQPLRYACDRCHFDKVRCSRTDQRANGNQDTDEPCSRCRKAQVACVQGIRGRVGRPAKSLKRKAVQYEEPLPTPRNDSFGIMADEASHEPHQRREQHQEQHPDPAIDEQPPTTEKSMTIGANDSEESFRSVSHPCHRSPLAYQTPDMATFSINTNETGSWEALMVPHDNFELGFIPSFDLHSFRTPTSDACFQDPSVATTSNSTDNSSEHDTLDDSSASTPIALSHCPDTTVINNHDTKEWVGSDVQTLPFPFAGDGHLPTPAPSIAPGVCAGATYEALSDLNLRIIAVLGKSEQDTVNGGGGRDLKDVSSLASELIDTARQIMPRLATNPSLSDAGDLASQGPKRGQNMAASNGDPIMSECNYNNTRRAQQYSSNSGFVFLLLACYSGVLRIFELVVEELWTRHNSAKYGGHGGARDSSVFSLLETSLAVHAVSYLLRLLREAMFPRDSSALDIDPMLIDGGGSAAWRGRGSSAVVRAAIRKALAPIAKDVSTRPSIEIETRSFLPAPSA
ncbi:hypothetical protein PG989_007397 [Apiospora arundinis]